MDKFNPMTIIEKIRNEAIYKAKKGGWIQQVTRSMEKKGTKGSFTEWCGGKVTEECIERGLRSKDEKIRRRAQLAKTFREMRKKEQGGSIDNANTSSYVEEIKRKYLSKINDNVQKNMLMDLAQKSLDLEDAYIDYINNAKRIQQLEQELYGGIVSYEEGGQYVNQNISYEEFVQFVMSYPEYLQRLMSELSSQQ